MASGVQIPVVRLVNQALRRDFALSGLVWSVVGDDQAAALPQCAANGLELAQQKVAVQATTAIEPTFELVRAVDLSHRVSRGFGSRNSRFLFWQLHCWALNGAQGTLWQKYLPVSCEVRSPAVRVCLVVKSGP